MHLKLVLPFFFCSIFLGLSAQNIQEAIYELGSKSKPFEVPVFVQNSENTEELRLNFESLNSIPEDNNVLLAVDIELNNVTHRLLLKEYFITDESSRAGTYDGINYNEEMAFDQSRHFRGVIENDSLSWVSFSFNSTFAKGLIATSQGNWIIDKKLGAEHYSLFLDKAQISPEWSCSTPDQGELISRLSGGAKMQTCPITLFWLADYDFFATNNYDYNACLFHLDAMFNSVAALYQQEGIALTLGSRYTYTVPDPYNPSDIFNCFLQFGSNIHQDANFLGHDLAMLINVDQFNSPAGYAVIDALCDNQFYYSPSNPNNVQGRFAASRIQPYYNNYPTYSSTIEIIAHEMGHNLGSRHTHWCGWPGGAIDGCASLEPDNFGSFCPNPGPVPSNSATLMSYCTLYWGTPVPLTNGFGFYPNQAITNAVSYYDACICSGLSIEETIDSEIRLLISPNPSSSYFEFKLDGNLVEVKGVQIIDLLGETVKSYTSTAVLEMSGLAPSTYIVKANYKDQQFLFSILLQ